MSTTVEEFKFEYGSIRKFDPQDLKYLLFDLIEEDKEYARFAGYGEGYASMVSDAVRGVASAFSIFDADGDFVCMCGVSATNKEGVGRVWILSSEGFNKNKNKFNIGAEFLRRSKDVLDFFNTIFPILMCRVVSANRDANRRTRFMGFSLHSFNGDFTEYIRHG